MFAIRSERDYVVEEDFMKAASCLAGEKPPGEQKGKKNMEKQLRYCRLFGIWCFKMAVCLDDFDC